MNHFTSIKQLSLMFVALMLSFTVSAQCNFTLNGFDSFGDGWNGGSLAITVDGTAVPGSPFAVSGSSGTWTFPVTSGGTIALIWTGGGFLGEVSFNLQDNVGTTLFNMPQGSAPPGTSTVYTATATCVFPCPTVVQNLSVGNYTLSTADLSWDALFGATNYNMEYGLAGFAPGTGNEIGTYSGTATSTTITGLSQSIDYEFYVESDCNNGWSAVEPFRVPCFDPTNFSLSIADLTSAVFNWTENGTATEWELEYGAVGFTLGSGTSVSTLTNPDTLTNLTPNSFYEIYVRSICGAGDNSNWVGPLVFNTYNQGLYMESDNQCPPAGFIDISASGTDLNLTDDGEAPVDPLPFDILFQGGLISNMTVGNNGGLILGTTTGFVGYGGNFNTLTDGTLFPWGDDLDEETGNVYWEQVGTSPNSVLVVQWDNSCNFAGAIGDPTVTFQIQIDEATGEIFYVYEDKIFGPPEELDDYAGRASIGISGPNQDITVSDDDQEYLQNNSCARFYYTNCPKPVDYNLTDVTFTTATFEWNAGLSNETDWQIIYGVEGFDPTQSGTSITVNSNTVTLPGLDDVTTYDVYILALCANGDTSNALIGEFTTLPNCADITDLSASSSVDSIFSSWNYTGNAGFPISEFAVQYGPTGFANGNGSYDWGLDINTTDTLVDQALIGGGLYDVYIQSICSTGDSSNWVGPVTVTMPLTNDSTCFAEALPVDGTVFTFDGAGATVQIDESTIAPAGGNCVSNIEWCNSTMSATTWFTFVAPPSGDIRIDGESAAFDGQIAVYQTSDCADFTQYTLVGANDDFDLSNDYPYLNLCGLNPGETYYLVHDPQASTGIYSLRIQEIIVEAGSDLGQLDVCRGDTVDLSTRVTGADEDGVWLESIFTSNFNDPIWPTDNLAAQSYTFEYLVVDGCVRDSVQTVVNLFGPSSAGQDGTIEVCQNQPLNLFAGLNGTVDAGGDWYDASNNLLPTSQPFGPAIPGDYNYDYIVSNGVCPPDTSLVEVIVSDTCDWLSVGEEMLNGISVYPNPTSDVINIEASSESVATRAEIFDMNGRLVAAETASDNVNIGFISVNHLETGIYTLRISGDLGQKTFKIVKQ